jgi:hypothetical protein
VGLFSEQAAFEEKYAVYSGGGCKAPKRVCRTAQGVDCTRTGRTSHPAQCVTIERSAANQIQTVAFIAPPFRNKERNDDHNDRWLVPSERLFAGLKRIPLFAHFPFFPRCSLPVLCLNSRAYNAALWQQTCMIRGARRIAQSVRIPPQERTLERQPFPPMFYTSDRAEFGWASIFAGGNIPWTSVSWKARRLT